MEAQSPMRQAIFVATAVLLETHIAAAAKLSVDIEFAGIYKICTRGDVSSVDTQICLGKKRDRLRDDLGRQVRQKLFDIDEVERRKPEIGMLAGKADADRWRAAFKAEQVAWESYENSRCGNVVEFEHYGGSGAGEYGLTCSIKHLLSRIRELRDLP
jgi:uncharacterized protein YecT (DUF1311 family)